MMKRYLGVALFLVFFGCVSTPNLEQKFYFQGCQAKLLTVDRALPMQVPQQFWIETDKEVINSFTKEEWKDIFLLLARIPSDYVGKRQRIVRKAYHVVYSTQGKPVGVTVGLFLGEQVFLRLSKDGHWRIFNVGLLCGG